MPSHSTKPLADVEAWNFGQDARVLIGAVAGGNELEYAFQPGRNAWVHVVHGEATVNGQTVSTGDAVALTGEPSLSVQGQAANSEVLVFDLAA